MNSLSPTESKTAANSEQSYPYVTNHRYSAMQQDMLNSKNAANKSNNIIKNRPSLCSKHVVSNSC